MNHLVLKNGKYFLFRKQCEDNFMAIEAKFSERVNNLNVTIKITFLDENILCIDNAIMGISMVCVNGSE